MFFQYMSSKNINTVNEIIEAMDVSQEEMALRTEFLNSLLLAKK
jgi:hypothetical protein